MVADHLQSLGLDEIRTGIAGHGVVGVLRGGLNGDGVRLFEHLGDEQIRLERIEVVDTDTATHLRYRVQAPSE